MRRKKLVTGRKKVFMDGKKVVTGGKKVVMDGKKVVMIPMGHRKYTTGKVIKCSI